MMRSPLPLALLVFACFSNAAVAAGSLPTTMLHFEVKLAEPKLPPNSPQGQTKEYWRVGNSMGRVKEAKDTAHNVQMEMLLLPPDFWQIDLVAKKATHITGSDKKEMHMAVFGGVPTDNPETAKTIKELEFGKELEFFKSHKAKKETKKNATGKTIDEYVLPLDKTVFLLDTDPKTNNPQRVGFTIDGKTIALEYSKYETIPYQESTFKPPADLSVQTVSQDDLKKQRAAQEEALIKKLTEMHKKDTSPAKSADPKK